MIRHTVAFNLKHAAGSAAEQAFLADAKSELTAIAGVRDFEQTRQVSGKNPYRFNFPMSFADQAAYDAYNVHPKHVAFVRDRWEKEVAEFLEADFVAL
ncbi:MAG: Dabb family protein [Devosia sp.]